MIAEVESAECVEEEASFISLISDPDRNLLCMLGNCTKWEGYVSSEERLEKLAGKKQKLEREVVQMCDDASRSATHSKPTSRKRCKVVNSIVTPASNPRKYRYQSLSPLPSASNNDTNSRSLDVEEIPKPSEEKLKKYMDILAAYKPELLKDRDPSLMLSDSHPQAGSSKAKPHHSHMSHHAQSSEHPHPLHRPGSSGYIQHHFDCSKPRPCDTNKSRSRGEEIQQELKWLI